MKEEIERKRKKKAKSKNINHMIDTSSAPHL